MLTSASADGLSRVDSVRAEALFLRRFLPHHSALGDLSQNWCNHQIAFLQSEKLRQALIFMDGVEVRHDAFPID